jgi:hypothetical protein
LQRSILSLACDVMFCQAQMRVRRVIEECEEALVGDLDEGMEEWGEKVDLGPLVEAWPTTRPDVGKVLETVEQLRRVTYELLEVLE